jgi:hypothetical protein
MIMMMAIAMGVKRTKSLVSSTTTTTDKEKTGDSGSDDEAKSGDSDSDDDANYLKHLHLIIQINERCSTSPLRPMNFMIPEHSIKVLHQL